MTKQKDRIITFILILIIIILTNAIINRFNFSIDLTKDKVYSLSPATKNLLKSLKEPMSIKFFVTPNLPPPFSTYERYIRDLISQYKVYGKKNVSIEIIDASKNQEMAEEYGINSTQISTLEKDQSQTKIVHMGLAFLYGDSKEIIPFVQSTEGLEYNINTLIRRMSDKNDKLTRLENNLNVYYIASDEIYELLPLGAMELIPEYILKAVNEANKDLMNKVVFRPIDMSHPTEEDEKIINRLNIKKITWNDIVDPNGKLVAEKGSAYFSLIIENGNEIREISTSYILYGAFDNIKDEILKSIDSLLGLKANIGYVQGHNEANYINIPVQFGGNPRDSYNSVSEYVAEIEDNYNFQPIDLALDNIPSNMDAIIVAGSKTALSKSELFKLDQFIMSGKPVLFLLSGIEINEDEENQELIFMGPTLKYIDNKINNILENYGLSIATNIVLDEKAYKAQIRQGEPEQSLYYIPLISPENINNKIDITKSINLIVSPMVSEVLTNATNNNIKITPLLYTSERSWIEGEGFNIANVIPPTDKEKYSKRLIAALAEGQMTSAFKNENIENNSLDSINRLDNTSNGKIIVVGSIDMAKNSAYSVNKIFLMNLVDYMVGDTGLMSIRRKGAIYNPPYQVSENVKLVVRILNIVIVPLSVIIFGLILWNRDKKRRKNIYEIFNNGEKE